MLWRDVSKCPLDPPVTGTVYRNHLSVHKYVYVQRTEVFRVS